MKISIDDPSFKASIGPRIASADSIGGAAELQGSIRAAARREADGRHRPRFIDPAEPVEFRRRAAAKIAVLGKMNHIQWLRLRPPELGQRLLINAVRLRSDKTIKVEWIASHAAPIARRRAYFARLVDWIGAGNPRTPSGPWIQLIPGPAS